MIGEYIDRAQSGTTDSRAEFQRMIADSDKHIFEGVLVYQLDRFARNRYDSAINKAKLKKNGVYRSGYPVCLLDFHAHGPALYLDDSVTFTRNGMGNAPILLTFFGGGQHF